MAYCDADDVRLLTNLATADISDADINSIVTEATAQLNNDINVSIVREFVQPIDSTRENKIDGSNTTYYVQNWHGKYFADRNNDGNVTTADVIVHQVTTTGTESTLTVSSIDDDDCNLTLSSAPSSGVRLYITYHYSYVRELAASLDARVKLACTLLTAAYCYAKINFGKAPSVQMGSSKLTRHMDSFKLYYERYLEVIKQIQQLGGLSEATVNIHTI